MELEHDPTQKAYDEDEVIVRRNISSHATLTPFVDVPMVVLLTPYNDTLNGITAVDA